MSDDTSTLPDESLEDDFGARVERYYWSTTGRIHYEWYLNYERSHREDGPSYTSYTEDGVKIHENYYIEGEFHREDGPALNGWFDNGIKCSEKYFTHGRQHREDGPSWVEWYPTGQKKYESFWVDGQIHRDDGPADVWYRQDGSVYHSEFYLDGCFLGFWDFYDKVSSEVQKTLLKQWLPYSHV